MAKPILQPASTLVTAAIDAIVAARPSTLAQFNNPNSRYRDVIALWRAQALLLQQRLASEVKARRLKTAESVQSGRRPRNVAVAVHGGEREVKPFEI